VATPSTATPKIPQRTTTQLGRRHNVNNAGDRSNSIVGGSMQDSKDDINGDRSPVAEHTPSPFNNDAADNQHSNDRGRATNFGTTDIRLGL
jgi:hypothetical protein